MEHHVLPLSPVKLIIVPFTQKGLLHLIYILIVFGAIFSFGSSYGQLSGSIRSHTTGLPIPYAHIYIKNTSIGTTSDFEGRYVLNRPVGQNDSIVFSCIGYKTKIISSAVLVNDTEITLTQESLLLNSVLITTLSPENIIINASQNIKNNYHSMVKGKLTHRILRQDSCLFYSDNVIKLSYPDMKLSQLTELTSSGNRVENDLVWSEDLETVISFDHISRSRGFLHPGNFDSWQYKIEGIYYIQDRMYYIISAVYKTPKSIPSYYATLHIEDDSYFVSLIEFSYNWKNVDFKQDGTVELYRLKSVSGRVLFEGEGPNHFLGKLHINMQYDLLDPVKRIKHTTLNHFYDAAFDRTY